MIEFHINKFVIIKFKLGCLYIDLVARDYEMLWSFLGQSTVEQVSRWHIISSITESESL